MISNDLIHYQFFSHLFDTWLSKKPSWSTAPKKPTDVDLNEGDMINCLLPLQDP